MAAPGALAQQVNGVLRRVARERDAILAEPRPPGADTPAWLWERWAVLRTESVLPAPHGRQTRFNPWTTGGGIQPSGPWQEWRRRAYDASHVAVDER